MCIRQLITGQMKSSAKVVDGTLILSLPDAISPVVWRWNLGDAKASALEVREEKGGQFKLVLKTPRGDVQDVAPFENRAKAMHALLAVSRAMENAQGQVYVPAHDNAAPDAATISSPAASPQQGKGDGMKLLAGLSTIAVILFLFFWLGNAMTRNTVSNISSTGTNRTAVSPASSENSNQSGVPMSADDFLMGR